MLYVTGFVRVALVAQHPVPFSPDIPPPNLPAVACHACPPPPPPLPTAPPPPPPPPACHYHHLPTSHTHLPPPACHYTDLLPTTRYCLQPLRYPAPACLHLLALYLYLTLSAPCRHTCLLLYRSPRPSPPTCPASLIAGYGSPTTYHLTTYLYLLCLALCHSPPSACPSPAAPVATATVLSPYAYSLHYQWSAPFYLQPPCLPATATRSSAALSHTTLPAGQFVVDKGDGTAVGVCLAHLTTARGGTVGDNAAGLLLSVTTTGRNDAGVDVMGRRQGAVLGGR